MAGKGIKAGAAKIRSSSGAAAKFKSAMGAYVASVTPKRAVRRPSGTGPGAAKARAGLQAAFGPKPPRKRTPPGSGPGIVKARAGLQKAFGHLG